MTLKHFLFPLFLLSIQLANAQEKLAIFAGPQITSAKYLIEERKQTTETKTGFMAGLGLKVPFEKRLSFFPVVSYSKKGYIVDFRDQAYPPSENAINNNTTIHAIDIAPLLQIDFSAGPNHLFIRFGPSIDVVVSGTETFDTLSLSGNVNRVTRPMKFSYTSYGKYSASLNGQLGYQSAGGFMIFAHYAYGIGSMNNADFGPRIVHRIAGISAGWLIGHRRSKALKQN